MERYTYPSLSDFRTFIHIISREEFAIAAYLPPITEQWYAMVSEITSYVEHTSTYETDTDFYDCCARIMYKVAKRHELRDGNKRSSVICVYLFCIVNDYVIVHPELLKKLAKRVAKTKGRANEKMIRTRIAAMMRKEIRKSV